MMASSPRSGTSTLTSRRLAFKIATLRQGLGMYDAARELGVSYNHLMLVLDGTRKGSAELEAAIAKVMK